MGQFVMEQLCDSREENIKLQRENIDLIHELERFRRFKSYWDGFYGTGLGVANWHQNGELEPLDNFYESALAEMDL